MTSQGALMPPGRPSPAPADGPSAFFAREGADPLRFAFDRKTGIHAGLGAGPVAPDAAEAHLAELLQTPRTGPTAAYFHIPFCSTRCTYCGFFSRFTQGGDSALYTDALIRELRATAGTPAVASGPVHAVYLGGGTPTDLEPPDLLRLLRAIRAELPLANDCEITLEGRVHGMNEALLGAALEGGANRFSIGVQSFDTRGRRLVGRLDDRETVLETLARLAAPDQASVVIDLVYGFPGQTVASWVEDVRTLERLPLDGVDLYQLNVLPHTTLARMIAEGRCEPAASLPEQAEMFSAGVDAMEAMAWSRLSVCHWRATSRERSLYNRLVKGGATILPYGCGAGGNLHGHGIMHTREFGRYLERVEAGRSPVAMMTRPSPLRVLAARIADGCDLGRLEVARLDAWAGEPVAARVQPLLDQWTRCGLLELRDGWARLTRAGEFWQVNLAQGLVDACRALVPSPVSVPPKEFAS